MDSSSERLSPRDRGDRKTHRKLPQIESADKNESKGPVSRPVHEHSASEKVEETLNNSDTKVHQDDMKSPRNAASVAYISETLITQLTKEHKLDLVMSLTIHLPKDKLNKKIKYIENLEKLKILQTLNLSNNMIEKMQKLESLVELRELNLSNNCIKVIEDVDTLVKLQTLNLSGNEITSIPGPQLKKLRCLKILKLAHNKLETLVDVTKLRCFQDLTNLDLQGNPFCGLPHYREFVIFQLRSLDILDNQAVTNEERLQADQRFAQEEVRRLEIELTKQEKLCAQLQTEKNEAGKKNEHLTKNQNLLKAKEASQKEIIEGLQHDIEAKNGLLKAKNSDLIRASENQYRLEQELAFYKLDAKFEMLGELPIMDDETELDDDHGLDDSAYIGKATFKRNAFTREHYIKDAAQVGQMGSLKMKYENDKHIRDDLDQIILEKRATILQLQEQLERLADDVDEKNNRLRQASDKLALLEMSMANQTANLDQGNELARQKLAEKIEFIKRLQAAAEELQERMNNVANDIERKRKELEELKRKAEKAGRENGAQPDLLEAIELKQAELQEACDELSKMKNDMEMLKDRIKNEQAQVEMLKKQLGKEASLSKEAVEQLKQELEGVIDELNKRQEQQEIVAREQEETIADLENERDNLRGKLAKNREMEETINSLQDQLDEAIGAFEREQVKCGMLEEREKDLREQLFANDKNNKLGVIEAQTKVKYLGKENEKLQEQIKQLKNQIQTERDNAKARVQRDQERIAKALEAAKLAGEKDDDIKGLALQVDALKATNEAVNDRLEDAENELKRKEKDCINKDDILRRLKDLLDDFKKGRKNARQPVDESDRVGHCLADLHQKYLDLADKLRDETEKGTKNEKQAREAIGNVEAQLAQVTSQLSAAEKGLAQLSQEGTEHEADMKNLEDDIYRLQENLRAALDKAGDEVNKRMRDKESYEEKMKTLEDEINKLQNNKKNRDQRDKELNQIRALAQRQKDRLEKEIRQLQNELNRLKDRHASELLRKDKELAELEALISEDEKLFTDKNKQEGEIQRELDKLKRLVLDKTKETQDAINNENQRKQVEEEFEDVRRQMKTDMNNAHSKIRQLENLLDEKEKQIKKLRKKGLELEHNVAAVTAELEDLKRALVKQERYETEPTIIHRVHHSKEKVSPRETVHRAHYHSTPVNHDIYQSIHHHHYDNSTPLTRPTTVSQTPALLSVTSPSDEVHYHHHYGNGDVTAVKTNIAPRTPVMVSTTAPFEEVYHRHHYDNGGVTADVINTVTQTPVVVSSTVRPEQVHYHHHKREEKKKKTKKKDYCNISEHEDLVDDVLDLEEELATSNNQLTSQISENKLSALRSDLRDLENTVVQTCRYRKSTDPLDSKLAETVAKFQDHMLTLMEHRANLSSGQTDKTF